MNGYVFGGNIEKTEINGSIYKTVRYGEIERNGTVYSMHYVVNDDMKAVDVMFKKEGETK